MSIWSIISGPLSPLSFVHPNKCRDVLLVDRIFMRVKGTNEEVEEISRSAFTKDSSFIVFLR